MEKVLSGIKKIHLIGIGGVGVSGLAFILKDKGFQISGSDFQVGSKIKALREAGIQVFIGHREEQIASDIDIVGYSSVIGEDNPEMIAARKKGIKVLKRRQLLSLLCTGKKAVAVAGSHGKTTTSSLIGYLFSCLGYKPAVFVGGTLLNFSRGAWWGDDYFVIETDESDGSFLYCNPWISIITNIDREHLDYYNNLESLKESFLNFSRQTKDKVFGWADQPCIKKIISEVGGIGFGWNKDNFVQGVNYKFEGKLSSFDLCVGGKFITSVKTPLLGKYNCLNVLAAFAFFNYLGEDLEKIKQHLLNFKGIKRRFEVKAVVDGVTFVDDYAHHPTEIKAVLSAARLLERKRLIVILQPHRFSRVKGLSDEFSQCLKGADKVIVTDVYSAHEKAIGDFSIKEFVETIKKHSCLDAKYIAKNYLAVTASSLLKSGDLVLGLGAGDIDVLMKEVVNEFEKNRAKT